MNILFLRVRLDEYSTHIRPTTEKYAQLSTFANQVNCMPELAAWGGRYLEKGECYNRGVLGVLEHQVYKQRNVSDYPASWALRSCELVLFCDRGQRSATPYLIDKLIMMSLIRTSLIRGVASGQPNFGAARLA